MRFGWKQSSRRNSNRDDYYPRDALGIGFGSQLLPFCAASSIAVIKPNLFFSFPFGSGGCSDFLILFCFFFVVDSRSCAYACAATSCGC
jgi:hypothetical protein